MTRNEAAELAETTTAEDLKQMFQTAKSQISDWGKTSRVNRGMTIGTSFNILSTGKIDDNTHHLAKTNMILEFGEYLPNYQKKMKETANKAIATIHQEPEDLNF